MIGLFGSVFPRKFTDDWMRVGAEEAMHFVLLDRRLREMGSCYGALPAHDGLWDAAVDTAYDASARLAIVPMVLEARGLSGLFDAVYGVEHADFHPKPDAAAFDKVFTLGGVTPTTAAMFEDYPRNLSVPHSLGMRTVHVAPEPLPQPHL